MTKYVIMARRGGSAKFFKLEEHASQMAALDRIGLMIDSERRWHTNSKYGFKPRKYDYKIKKVI